MYVLIDCMAQIFPAKKPKNPNSQNFPITSSLPQHSATEFIHPHVLLFIFDVVLYIHVHVYRNQIMFPILNSAVKKAIKCLMI